MTTLASAFVQIEPDLKTFREKLQAGLKSALPVAGKSATTAGTAAGAAYGVAFVAQAGQAIGAAGVLPAAGIAAAQAIGTIKLAFSGMSDVIKEAGTDQKKYNEELAKLPPQQRAVVKEIVALKPAFDLVRQASFNIFPGVQSAIKDLATNLPAVQDGIEQTALGLSDIAQRAGKEFSGPLFTAQLGDVLNVNARSVHNFAAAGVDLAKSLFNVAFAGSHVLEGLSEMVQQGAQAVKLWVDQKTASGELATAIDNGVLKIQQLGGVVFNVGSAIFNTFHAAGAGAGDLVLGLNHITDKLREFTETPQYAANINTLFQALNSGSGVAVGVLGKVVDLIKFFKSELDINIDNVFGGWDGVFGRINAAAGPLQETIRGILSVIASLVPIVINLLTSGIGPLSIGLNILGPILQQVANFFTMFPTLTGSVVVGLLTLVTIIKTLGITVRLIIAIQEAWIVVTQLLSAAWALSPFGVIVIAIIALVAALIYAYKNSETFRDIVQGALNGLKVAALAVFDALKVAIHALVVAFFAVKDAAVAVANAFVAAWDWVVGAFNAIKDKIAAVFNGIWNVITTVISAVVEFVKTHVELMLIVFLGPIGLILALIYHFRDEIAGAFVALWHLVEPVVDIMWSVIKTAFNTGKDFVLAIWNALWTAISTVFNIAKDLILGYLNLWWTAFTTAFNIGKAALEAVWNVLWSVIQTTFNLVSGIVKAGVDALWTALTAAFNLGRSILEPIWNGLWGAIKAVVDTMKTLIMVGVNGFLDAVKGAFNTAKDGIKTIWDQVSGIAKAPIKFVVDTVFNNGLRKAWNAVADFLNLPLKIGEIPTFRSGGKVKGPGSETSDDIWAKLSNNEFVVNARSTRRWLPWLEYINSEGANVAPPSDSRPKNQPDGFALGGLIGAAAGLGKSAWDATGGRVVSGVSSTFTSIVGAVIDFVREGAAKGFDLAMTPVKALINATLGTNKTQFKGNIGEMGMDLIQTVHNMVAGAEDAKNAAADKAIPGLGGVQQWRNVIVSALQRTGHTADEGAIQTVMRRMAQESGGNQFAINNWDSNAANGTPSKGLMQVIDPTFARYRDAGLSGDIYNALANVVASIRYADARYGSYVTGFNRPGGYRFGGLVKFDNGGILNPGITTAVNKTGKPEFIFTQEQLRAMGNDGDVHLEAHVYVGDRELTDIVDERVERKDQSDGRQVRYGRKAVG